MNDWFVWGTVLVLGMAVGAAGLNWWMARKSFRDSLTRVDSLRLVQTQEPVLPKPKPRYTGAPRHNRIS